MRETDDLNPRKRYRPKQYKSKRICIMRLERGRNNSKGWVINPYQHATQNSFIPKSADKQDSYDVRQGGANKADSNSNKYTRL